MSEPKLPANPKASEQPAQQQLQVHVPPDLEYCYRDMFSIFVGAEDVVIELGNRHRSMAGRATVNNRIVLSVANAFRLHQALGQMLQNARQRMEEKAKQKDVQKDRA